MFCRDFSEAQECVLLPRFCDCLSVVVILFNSPAVNRESVVIISPDLKRDSSAVKAFVNVSSVHMSAMHPVIIRSDGCGARYKSRVPMQNICQSFGFTQSVTSNYLGSCHGKGESDGESAVVKNFLDHSIKSEQLTIARDYDAFTLLKTLNCHVFDGASRRHF